MLFKKSRSNSSQKGTSEEGLGQGGLQNRWLVTSLALMIFAKKYYYYFPIGRNDWDDLPYDSDRDNQPVSKPRNSNSNSIPNKSINQTKTKTKPKLRIKQSYDANGNEQGDKIIYSPHQEDFISTKWASPENPIMSSDSKYTYVLHHQVADYISLSQVNNNFNNEMKGNIIENKDTKEKREEFAQSLADNVASSNDSGADNSTVKNTILNQISTNPILSEEYEHFLTVRETADDSSSSAQSALNAEKAASEKAQSYQASASSANATLNSVNNNYNKSQQTSQTSEVNSNEDNNADSEASQNTTLSSENSASVYYDQAKSEYSKVDSVYNFTVSVSGYIDNSKQRFNDYSQTTHNHINDSNRLMDQLDDDGEELSQYFNSLTADDQEKVNNINRNIQSISTENDSIAEQLDQSKSRVSETITKLSSNISLVNSTYNNAKRFLSAADGSFNNSDENATKIYASYVSSAASKAVSTNQQINQALNNFNSDLAQNSSYAEKTQISSSLISSDSLKNNQILQNIKVQVAANSIAAEKSASVAAAKSAEQASIQASQMASVKAAQSSEQASIAAAKSASEAAVRSSEQASIAAAERSLAEAKQASIAAAESASAENERLAKQASLAALNSNVAADEAAKPSVNNSSNDDSFSVNDIIDDNYHSFGDSVDSNPLSVTDPDVQEKLNTISLNYNNAAKIVDRIQDSTKTLVNNNQRLQDLFTLLKGELIQTKERAVQGNTNGMVAMMISKLNSLMNNASELIENVKHLNADNSASYESSVQALNNIKRYQDQLNSLIKISQSFDPLTSVSIDSMATSTLTKTTEYYNQIKGVNDSLIKTSKNIQSQIDVMKSYYQFAAKNSELMDSINQMNSVTNSIDSQSNQISSAYNGVNTNFVNFNDLKSQADSLVYKMDDVKNNINQKQVIIDGYSKIMANNSSLASLGDQVSSAAQQITSAQNSVDDHANHVIQTRSLASGSIDEFNHLYSQIQLMSMNTKYQASQAVINFNTGDTSNADKNISQMNDYKNSLSSMFTEASNMANGIGDIFGQVSSNASIDSLEQVVSSAASQVDVSLHRATSVYGGLNSGIIRANDMATSVSDILDHAKQQVGSADQLFANVKSNAKKINDTLKSISTSNDISQLYAKQIVSQLNDANNPSSRKASDLAQNAKQSFAGASAIKKNLQQINDKLVQLDDNMPNNYSSISNQSDTANDEIQKAFKALSEGDLNVAQDRLNQSNNSVNNAKRILESVKEDVNWLQSAVNVTDRLAEQSQQIKSVISDAASSVQTIFNQLGLAN